MAKSRFVIWIEYFPVRCLIAVFNRLPVTFLPAFAELLGALARILVRSARKTAEINLDLVYGLRKTTDEKNTIIRESFRSNIRTFGEFINFPRLSNEMLLSKTSCTTLNRIDSALSKKKGIIFCSIHLSNWYWPAAYAGARGYATYAVDRPLDNPLLDSMMRAIGTQKNLHLIPRSAATRTCLRLLRENKIIALMTDQNAAVGGIFVPWFGHFASSMAGASFFHRLSGAPVHCGHSIRQPDGTFSVEYSEEIPMTGDDTENMRRIFAHFEKVILSCPEQYFWMHPRWKKRPEGETSFYGKLRV